MKKIALFTETRNSLTDKHIDIFKRQVGKKCGADTVVSGKANSDIVLGIDASVGKEGFMIRDIAGGGIRIAGGDERGVLYGLGKLLRTSTYDVEKGWVPGRWRGVSLPEKSVRGMYFATHFHNFYEDAPIADVQEYVEDLALWGYNAFMTWLDLDYYPDLKCGTARNMMARMKAMLFHARRIGLDTGLISVSNQGFASSPREWLAETVRRPHGKNPLCVAKAGVREAILDSRREQFEVVTDLRPEYLCLWPYDPGGCACVRCRPWGGNGYLTISEPIARLFKEYFPKAKVILSTWFFDRYPEGEWEGLARAFKDGTDWADYIMAEGTGDPFPSYPLKNGVPGGLPMLGFPEISMWNMKPWGGFGANPGLNRFQTIWDSVSRHLEGGFPYSEGIFEDISKAVYGQFYWKSDAKSHDTAREYIAYEFSPAVVDDVIRAMEILEENNSFRWSPNKDEPGVTRRPLRDDAGSAEVYDLLKNADSRLSPSARKAWRWRILMLRGLIDRELYNNGGLSTPACEDAFGELTSIYHAQKALFQCAPPSEEAIKAMRGGEHVNKLDLG